MEITEEAVNIFLDSPFEIKGNSPSCRNAFFGLAFQRTYFVSKEEFRLFLKQLYGEVPEGYDAAMGVGATADAEVVCVADGKAKNYTRRYAVILLAVVNEDYFTVNGVFEKDLACYAAYHEAWETWLFVKKGFSLRDEKWKWLRHCIARRKETELALRRGKFDALYAFAKVKDPEIAKQYLQARDAVLKRRRLVAPPDTGTVARTVFGPGSRSAIPILSSDIRGTTFADREKEIEAAASNARAIMAGLKALHRNWISGFVNNSASFPPLGIPFPEDRLWQTNDKAWAAKAEEIVAAVLRTDKSLHWLQQLSGTAECVGRITPTIG